MRWNHAIRRAVSMIMLALILLILTGPGGFDRGDELEQIRTYTRVEEFEYFSWTWDAVWVKLRQLALPAEDYLPAEEQRQVVYEYLHLAGEIQQVEAAINDIYADPDQDEIEERLRPFRTQLGQLMAARAAEGPLAEAVIQDQVASVLEDLGFAQVGLPFPPVLYRSTPLPWALIVSPRDVIRQDALISLRTQLTLEEHILLEDEISEDMGVSTLVVPVGGIGSYPTMVAETTNLPWLLEVVAHEWTHNYLNLRPLGISYGRTPELRTMNETAASIAGTEISRKVLEKFYPELLPPPAAIDEGARVPSVNPEPPGFDFRAEMHETRVKADALLAEGKIEAAEAYMEARRLIFWENGYRIRKLNQAYFAFHGAYADVPGGAAGEDPVGAAVRALRARSEDLLDFIKQMAWLTSFEELQMMVADFNG